MSQLQQAELRQLGQALQQDLQAVITQGLAGQLDFQRPWALLQSGTEEGKARGFQLTLLKAEAPGGVLLTQLQYLDSSLEFWF